MKITATIIIALIVLGGCTSPSKTSNNSQTSQESRMTGNTSVSRISVQASDVEVYAATGGPNSSKTVVVGPVMFSPGSSVSTRADFPISVVYALRDNERTQRIKNEGAVVYVEAVPFLRTQLRFPDGRTDIQELGVNIEDYRYGCARTSRMVALAPANNYRYEYVVEQEIFIRTSNTAGYPDREITEISPGGRVYQASLNRISPSQKTCYVTRTRSYFGR